MPYRESSRNSEKEYNKRIEDLEFLARVRCAELDELKHLWQNHRGSSAPAWKQIAITRAIKRKYTK